MIKVTLKWQEMSVFIKILDGKLSVAIAIYGALVESNSRIQTQSRTLHSRIYGDATLCVYNDRLKYIKQRSAVGIKYALFTTH